MAMTVKRMARREQSKWLLPFVFMAFVLVQSSLNVSLRKNSPSPIDTSEHEQLHRWHPALYRLLSFGHLPAVVDWLWLESLLDSSLVRLPRGQHPPLYDRLMLATDLDPLFFEAYYAGGNLLAVIRDDVIGARDLVERGLEVSKTSLPQYPERFRQEHWRGAWSLGALLGYVYLFELQDMPKAAEAFRSGGQFPGAPPYLIRLAERLERPGGEYEVGLRLLNFMIDSQQDPRVRDELLEKRKSLFIAQHIAELNRMFNEYVRGHMARTPSDQQERQRLWRAFTKDQNILLNDPWGGRISLDRQGHVVTTTPYKKVFGLD